MAVPRWHDTWAPGNILHQRGTFSHARKRVGNAQHCPFSLLRAAEQTALHHPATRGSTPIRLTPAHLVGPDKAQWVALAPLHPPATSPPPSQQVPAGARPAACGSSTAGPTGPFQAIVTSPGNLLLLAPWSGQFGGSACSMPPFLLTLQAYPAGMIRLLSSIGESHFFIQQTSICTEVVCQDLP